MVRRRVYLFLYRDRDVDCDSCSNSISYWITGIAGQRTSVHNISHETHHLDVFGQSSRNASGEFVPSCSAMLQR